MKLVVSGGLASFTSDYKPYGDSYQKTGTITFGYTGKLYDGTIGGLYYYNARFYDPDFGRFITQDSYMGSASDPMSLNRYIYARDNPERYVDPSGHMVLSSTSAGDNFDNQLLILGGTTTAEVEASIEATASALQYEAYLASLDKSDVRKVCYTPGLTTVTVGTVGTTLRPSDVILTQEGENKYSSIQDATGFGGPIQSSLQIQPPEPPSLELAHILADAAFDSVKIPFGTGYDVAKGTFGIGDALAFGFDTGGILSTFLGVPMVGIPAILLAEGIWEASHPNGGL